MESERTLTEKIQVAIANRDAKVIHKFIEICDKLHKGIEVEGYDFDDLPSDDLYEQMKKIYDELISKTISKISTPKLINRKYITKERQQLSDMYMAKTAIIKNSKIAVKNTKILCTPKYDGVSCSVRFIYNTEVGKYIIDDAETRGMDLGFSHKNTNLTNRFIGLINSPTCPWFKKKFHQIFHSLSVEVITIRGEIVLLDKSERAPASYVAGKVNSKSKIIDVEGKIGFKMFEFVRYKKFSDEKIYVPIQEKVCKVIQAIDNSVRFEFIELGSNENENDKLVKNLFDRWNVELDSPIDGVVYSDPSWTYPQYKEDASGVSYGKYALKPHTSSPSKVTSIEYTVSKDGKLNPIINFETIQISGRNISRAKISINKLMEFIDGKLGPGSVINITLNGGIPYVDNIIPDTAKCPPSQLIQLPRTCQFCHDKLKINLSKINTIKCENVNCPGVVVKMLVNLLKILKISGYAEKSLMKILDENDNNFESIFTTINSKYGEEFVKNKVSECSVGDLVVGLNICTVTKLRDFDYIYAIKARKVSEELKIVRNFVDQFSNPLIGLIRKYM